MSVRRFFASATSRLASAFVFSLTFATLAHAASTLPIDVVDGKPSGAGGGGRGSLLLSGGNVQPDGGEIGAVVNGTISFNRTDVCFEFTVTSLSGHITHIGIYQGVAGVTGPEVVVLNPMPPGIMGLRGCVPIDRTLARTISNHKRGYYVQIFTDAYPGGAVRSQLGY